MTGDTMVSIQHATVSLPLFDEGCEIFIIFANEESSINSPSASRIFDHKIPLIGQRGGIISERSDNLSRK